MPKNIICQALENSFSRLYKIEKSFKMLLNA